MFVTDSIQPKNVKKIKKEVYIKKRMLFILIEYPNIYNDIILYHT